MEQISDSSIVGEPGQQRVGEERARHPRPAELPRRRPHDHRPDQQQRQRRHDRALRLEGAEQVAAALLGRGLQRRDGHHQRAVHDRARRERVAASTRPTPNSITDTEAATPVDAMSSIEKFSLFMRFLAPPVPSTDTPGGAASIAGGQAAVRRDRLRACHTPTLTTGNSSGRGAEQPEGEPVLRPAAARHGPGARGRCQPG